MEVTVPEGCPLTEKQYMVASLVGDCRPLREIAELLDIDIALVRWHVRAAAERLGVNGVSGLMVEMIDRGWDVCLDPPVRGADAYIDTDLADRTLHLTRLLGVR